MVKFHPFCGLRPPKEIAEKVIAPPYDVIERDEALKLAEGNPISFLHINKPEIDQEDDVHDDDYYALAAKNLEDFIKRKILVRDDGEYFYVYSQQMGKHIQYGIVGSAWTKDYEENRIKKHELTRKDKEEDRTKMTDSQNTNIGPVFLMYHENKKITEIVNEVIKATPDAKCDFSYDKTIHTIWVVRNPTFINSLKAEFENIPAFYIADGHHRAASAFNVAKKRFAEAKEKGEIIKEDDTRTFFLAVAFPSNQLQIFEYNRIVKTLNGLTEENFLEKLKNDYEVTLLSEENPRPKEKQQFTMYMNKKWYLLKLKKMITSKDPIENLDCSILNRTVLEPILGIMDLRTSKEISFVGGIHGPAGLKKRCDDSKSAVAFNLYPVIPEEIMNISDSDKIMPPKSTWFEPKLVSGLCVRTYHTDW